MSPSLVLSANCLVGVALLAVAASDRLAHWLSRRTAALVALAGLPFLAATLLAVYVFGEDSYRGNGISRWDAYRSPGGALGPMFVLSVVLMAVCAVLLFYAGLRSRGRLLRLTGFAAGLVSVGLLTVTTIGFTVN